MSDRTSKSAIATIARLAAGSFKDHVLTRRADGGWRCGAPGTGHHAFNVFTPPYAVMVWGDLGDFVWNHSDVNSMAWWLGASSRDYFLEKLRACCDGAKEEFMYGDAMAHLLECRRNVKVDGYAGQDLNLRKERIANVGEAMAAVRDDHETEQSRTWWEAWRDNGDSDPPDCMGWKSGPLWAWEAALTFRRLYASLPGIDTDYGQRLLVAANGPQPAIEVPRG